MIRHLLIVALAAGLAGAAGCARRTPPQATAADAERANVELAELAQGRKLLLSKCGGCHKTPLPGDRTPAEWPAMLDDMGERANLDDHQEHLIEQYLITMATAEPRK